MGKDPVIAILFEGSSENIFYPGQVVSGNLLVETSEQIKMRGIRMEVTGHATVHWSEGSGKNKRSYSGHENFINLRMYLIGSENNSAEMYVEPGSNRWPFSFLLPESLPSSFDGLYGHIKYKVKAVIDRPMKIDDTTDVQITVIRVLDLNFEPPQLKEPVVVQNPNPAPDCCYFCCCVQGLPEVEITLNRGCFVPGETILVGGQITNRSNTKFNRTVIALVQVTEFCATTMGGQIYRRKFVNNVLANSERPSLESGQTDNWGTIAFVIPHTVASRVDGSSIINVYYFIEVKAAASRCWADIGHRQEIIIGHVPLQSGIVTTQPPAYPALSYGAAFDSSYLPAKLDSSEVLAGIELDETSNWNSKKEPMLEVHQY